MAQSTEHTAGTEEGVGTPPPGPETAPPGAGDRVVASDDSGVAEAATAVPLTGPAPDDTNPIATPPPADAAAPAAPERHKTPPYLTPFPDGLEHIALVAGGGQFPQLLGQAARSRGVKVTGFGLRGFADDSLASSVDALEWIELGQLNKLIARLHALGIRHLAMVGRVQHTSIFQYRHFDTRAVKLLASAINRKADTLLGLISRELAKEGIEVLDSTLFIRSFMPRPGLITTKRKLTDEEQEDIDFGVPLARRVAGMDIGQSIVVKGKVVLAVEAAEGTDGCIERAAALGGDGIVLVKVSKPQQDFRFDVPVIGVRTIELMERVKGAVIALSANESIIFNHDEVVTRAEAAGIAIVAIENPADAASTG